MGFVDSLEPGPERTKWMTIRSVVMNLGNALGPAVGITLFVATHSNRWEVSTVHVVLCVSAASQAFAFFFLCGWKDVPPYDTITSDEKQSDDDPNTSLDVPLIAPTTSSSSCC